MNAYEQTLAQRELQRHLSMLLRLGAIQEHASTPEAWRAVLDCKDKEIAALHALNLAGTLQAGRELLATLAPGSHPELTELVALNIDALLRLCASEAEAARRARLQTEALRRKVTAARRGTRLSAAYAPTAAPRFLDHTR